MFRAVLICAFFVISFCFLSFIQSRRLWILNRGRRLGLYPPRDKATMFHVRDLILKKEKDLAIQLYGEIFNVTSRQARQAVEELEHGIHQKHPEIE